MRLALYDTETTGLEPRHQAIELACILYDTNHAQMVSSWSTLVQATENEAQAVNGIPPELLLLATPREKAWARLGHCFSYADVIVAHNADFDRSMTHPEAAERKPWADSCNDMVWPRGKVGSSLTSLALAHGVGIASAHRALADVFTLMLLFQRVQDMGADVPAMVQRALRPKVRVVGRQKFEENEVAKANGFRWRPEERAWIRNMPAEDIASLPFHAEVA